MRSGGGKAKGAGFERKICKILSLWVSNGKSQDLFWRTAMSGGRATVHLRSNIMIRQAGDICAVAPEGFPFADYWFVECKNVKDAGWASFFISNTGPLAAFWRKAKEEAKKHNRNPMIIIQARGPILVITNRDAWRYQPTKHRPVAVLVKGGLQGVDVFKLHSMVRGVDAARRLLK